MSDSPMTEIKMEAQRLASEWQASDDTKIAKALKLKEAQQFVDELGLKAPSASVVAGHHIDEDIPCGVGQDHVEATGLSDLANLKVLIDMLKAAWVAKYRDGNLEIIFDTESRKIAEARVGQTDIGVKW